MPRLHDRLRLVAVATVLSAGAAAIGEIACGSDDGASAPADDAGLDTGSLAESQCPKDKPAPGDTCPLPEGTTCAFASCGGDIAVCTQGAWRFAANPPVAPPCPTAPPSTGDLCAKCWPAARTCSFFAESCSAPVAVASCPDASWEVAISPCDAGADVQGDADLDAD